ncbi:serine hydrolase [Puia sp.]|jgi:CubicO group peptidase (beta-lactamase class C family)|uniref:serine hydrolase n=1 Tax=Puia sp. TaxID=2045100 RepID=UPI002F429284
MRSLFIYLFFICVFFPRSIFAADTAGMRREIMTVFAQQPQASFAVAFRDLSSGVSFFINEHERFHAASTMKTPVLIEAFKLIAGHQLSLSEPILIHLDFMSIADSSRFILDSTSDSERELYGLAGQRLPLRELLYKMITESSNLATNLVIERVGAQRVMATMREMGAREIQVLRGVEDTKAFERGMNNTTTAYDLMVLFNEIATGKAVDAASCEAMIAILKDQHFKESIGGRLPADVLVASKSGSITAVCHDSGIVFLPDGRKYVVVLLSKGITDEGVAHDLLATVSRIIYDHVAGPGRGPDLSAAIPVVNKLYRAYAEKNHYPGMVYGIVAGGDLVYSNAVGWTDVQKKIAAGATADFRIASMTKSFTTVAILQLRDAGKLKLDDPASLYIPELKGQHGPASDAPEISIRNLLTHSAGFPEDNPWGDRQLEATDEQLMALVREGISFSNSPGMYYEYSNLGFTLLGHIVGKVSGMSYEHYITEHVLNPLGMTHTYWDYTNVPADKLAHGYRWLNGEWVEQPMLHDGAFGAMGGLITSMEDFARYTAWQLSAWPSRDGGDESVLRRSSRREMQQPWMFNSLNSKFSYNGVEACPVTSAYAYGIRWSKDCKGRTMVGHTGGLPGFGSNWMILPDYGVGVVCFANLTYAGTSTINMQVLDTLITLAHLKPREVPASAILVERRTELAALLPDWDRAKQSGIFAVNFWQDYFVDSLRKEAEGLYARVGKIMRVGEMHAENGLRGWFLLEGEKGNLEVRVTLTPEHSPKIQEYHIRIAPVR